MWDGNIKTWFTSDSSIALHYMLVKFAGLVEHLIVDSDRMKANLDSTHGLVFSQAVLLALIEEGMTRDEAYRVVQRNGMAAWNGEGHLKDLLAADPEVTLSETKLDGCFDLERIKQTARPVFARLENLTQA